MKQNDEKYMFLVTNLLVFYLSVLSNQGNGALSIFSIIFYFINFDGFIICVILIIVYLLHFFLHT